MECPLEALLCTQRENYDIARYLINVLPTVFLDKFFLGQFLAERTLSTNCSCSQTRIFTDFLRSYS